MLAVLSLAAHVGYVAPAARTGASVRAAVRMEDVSAAAAAPAPPPGPKMSPCIPFLKASTILDGSMVGDVGFDPFNLASIESEYINLKWFREAELKHGRLAMLATLGFVMVDIGFKLPGDGYAGVTSLNAHAVNVEYGNMFKLFLLVASVEALTGKELFEPDHKPGNYGWDPLDLAEGNDFAELELAELKNGRLAMIAFSGIVTQAALTGKGFPYF